jgi:hypothetical protein
MVPQTPRNGSLKLALQWHATTRLLVGTSALVMVLASWGFRQIQFQDLAPTGSQVAIRGVTPGFILLIITSFIILLSAASIFSYVKTEPDPITTNARLMVVKSSIVRFPLLELVLDFVLLAIVVLLTGGLDSIFLPLFVIALLLSDVSLDNDHRRAIMLVVFLVTAAITVLVAETSFLRCLVLSGVVIDEASSCPDAVWSLSPWLKNFSGSLVFVIGTVLGSFVLKGYIGRASRSHGGATT